jgi:hypothetical protein
MKTVPKLLLSLYERLWFLQHFPWRIYFLVVMDTFCYFLVNKCFFQLKLGYITILKKHLTWPNATSWCPPHKQPEISFFTTPNTYRIGVVL